MRNKNRLLSITLLVICSIKFNAAFGQVSTGTNSISAGQYVGSSTSVDVDNVTQQNQNINFFTNGGTTYPWANLRMTILSTGEVGIGTTGPLRALEVNNDINLSSSTLNHGYRIGDIVVLQKPGSENIFVGENAGGTSLTSGNQNVVVGKDAGASLTDGTGNVLIGFEAGNKVQNSSSYENTFVGLQAGKATGTSGLNGNHNCFFGDNAGLKNDDGSENTFIGAHCGDQNVGGFQNVCIGGLAGHLNTTNYNTYIGFQAGGINSL